MLTDLSIQRFKAEFYLSLAVIQRKIYSYSEYPGVKTAPGLEFTDILYYFDKRILR
jgi:hypothetical protein